MQTLDARTQRSFEESKHYELGLEFQVVSKSALQFSFNQNDYQIVERNYNLHPDYRRTNTYGDSKYPVVPGHEIVGIVQEVGSHVHRFKIGDPIGVGTYINSCRNCDECNGGLEVQCPDGMVPTINAVDVDGITVYTPMIHHKMNQPGKSLGVIGLGGLGHMAVQFGKAFGLNVTVFSTSISKKEEALNVLGADKFVVTTEEEEMKALS
ncbi:unnamed protein product [Dovyalis caffra]|uniref:Alcohol dehydrogenase-like N-terminal domain-containing protein n=1 Tax=Dovyalis caffra TaxID=77055 RepID=A0AAV1RHJ4_9ROSI|nr:unnamed protein product [Dovyalis caffra]